MMYGKTVIKVYSKETQDTKKKNKDFYSSALPLANETHHGRNKCFFFYSYLLELFKHKGTIWNFLNDKRSSSIRSSKINYERKITKGLAALNARN